MATGAGIIVLLGDADDGSRMLEALDRAIRAGDGTDTARFVIVNDSLRDASDVIAELSDATRTRLVGVAPRAIVPSVEQPPGFFATNAHDCAVMIALAAAQAGSDQPSAIAAQMASVSSGGRV